MIWVRRGAVVLVVYLFFLIMTLPAAWLVRFLPLPETTVLQGVSGTVWQGEIAVLRDRRIVLDKVKWDLSFWPLIMGDLDAEVNIGTRHSDIRGQARIIADPGGIAIYDGSLIVPAQFVGAVSNLPGRATLDGTMKYFVEEFEHGLPWCETLVGDIFWESASFNNNMIKTPVALGQISTQLSCVDGQVVFDLDGSQSPLAASGSIRLPDRQRAVGTIMLNPDRSLPKEVIEGLEFLSEKTPEGLKFEFDTKLP
ncbi:type II secretion system protein N [Corallincola platygyrae]|uniref:Type II secretion system protein N n=1 Tax=Corallincola platygyrae TaxID=1193278 RepID=A0ABW4XNL6_9GAMM